MHFIIRLFPEIIVKSSSVRNLWSKRLANNIRIMVRNIHHKASVRLDWDRLIVRVPVEDPEIEARVVNLLSHTPGIANFAKVYNYPFDTLDDILQRVIPMWRDQLENKTFSVRVKRSGKHPFSSGDVERLVGAGVLKNTINNGVNLKHPDVTIHIEIKEDVCHLVERKIEGLGGFPMGTQDAVLSLISGGFDSTVASYLFMRRGAKTHFCFFNLGGREHEVAVKELAYYLWSTYSASHRVRFVTVHFEKVVAEIMRSITPAKTGVVLKRMMIRAATKLADNGGIDALVTGEALSQVSSQTLHNLCLIDAVSDRPILRPLITMGKPDIISMSRDIGAEAFCAAIPEYCGAVSVRPSAKVNREKLEAMEKGFNDDVLLEAIDTAVVERIDQVVTCDAADKTVVEEVAEPQPNDVVIDIRHPNEVELRPLHKNISGALTIPFYNLNSALADLDVSERYLLYCDKGVMSKLHAAHLMDLGYTNFGVYRPGSN